MVKHSLRLPLAVIASVLSAQAQTFEQVAPQTPPVDPAPVALPAAPEPAAPAAAGVITPELRGIVFVAEPAALKRDGVSSEGVDLAAVPRLETPAFRASLETRLGRPLTFDDLDAIVREAVVVYRAADRPVVDVIAPEQNVQSGVVQFLVVEGRLGKVSAEGNRWFSSERITGAIRTAPGEPLAGSALLSDLAWLNQNPFRRADLMFERGAGAGETDVVLRVQDRLPLRVYAGYDNSGTPLTDEDRVFAGFNWGDAFGLDHQLNYQLTASPDVDQFVAHSGSYLIPLPWRHTLTFFGSYGESRPDGLAPFNLDGVSWQASARYRVPLKTWRGVEHAFTAGFDFKRSDNDLGFGGVSVFAHANDVVQAVLSYSASRADKHGATSAELTLALSPGEIGGRNSDSDYSAARADASSRYAYAKLALERSTQLPEGFVWIARATGQLSSTNLLGSEQLGLGGADALRGYDEREANGDGGFVVVNELRGPALNVARHLGERVADSLVPLVFLDGGVAVIKHPLPGEERTRELLSAGVGVRYTLASNLIARADYGWQLRDSGASPTGDNRRAHVSVTLAW